MMDTNKVFCRLLMDISIDHGVKYVIGSPGSRNTPLLLAAKAREDIKSIIITDERTAAFVALGISVVSRKPVMLVCTSGTALLNYAPAVAEAYYQGIPLIVVSADRPVQWIDQDDSQTIHQYEALGNFVKRSYDIPCENSNEELSWYAQRSFNDALALSLNDKPGPVHINIQLDRPLGSTENKIDDNHRFISWISPKGSVPPKIMKELCEEAYNKKILIVAGFMQPSYSLNKAMLRLNKLENVYILAETLSNLHLGEDCNAVDSIISFMKEDDDIEFKPDIVITCGGALVSRMLKEYLRKQANISHWTVGLSNKTIDCFKALTKNIITDPDVFFREFAACFESYSRKQNNFKPTYYKENWNKLRKYALVSQKSFISSIGWSELLAFEKIFRYLPMDYNVFLSNGTPIRYAQLLISSMPHATYCNRGVSGIEGTNATAAGCALAFKGRTVLITGDLSFSYDVSVLGINELPEDFAIILINNNGGGIFRFISQTKDLPNREELFGRNQSLPVEGIVNAYGWKYFSIHNEDTAENILPTFFSLKSRRLLEIMTPDSYSAEVLIDYMNRNK